MGGRAASTPSTLEIPLIGRSLRPLLHRADSVCFLGMQEKHQKDTKPGPCAEGTKLDVERLEHLVATHCRLREEQIEQLDRQLKKLLFELLELQQARNEIEALPPVHNCLEHAEETWISHEDEDSVFEEPVVNCKLCGEDITSEFYEFVEIEPEEHNKEGGFD